MKLINSEIYFLANAFNEAFANFDQYIPVKANFILQKNAQVLAAAAQEIEKARLEVAQHYGVLNEEAGRYDIPTDKIQEAQAELDNLFAIEQDLPIKKLPIESFGDVGFTPAQMQAIMFMIDEEE